MNLQTLITTAKCPMTVLGFILEAGLQQTQLVADEKEFEKDVEEYLAAVALAIKLHKEGSLVYHTPYLQYAMKVASEAGVAEIVDGRVKDGDKSGT